MAPPPPPESQKTTTTTETEEQPSAAPPSKLPAPSIFRMLAFGCCPVTTLACTYNTMSCPCFLYACCCVDCTVMTLALGCLLSMDMCVCSSRGFPLEPLFLSPLTALMLQTSLLRYLAGGMQVLSDENGRWYTVGEVEPVESSPQLGWLTARGHWRASHEEHHHLTGLHQGRVVSCSVSDAPSQ